MPRLPAERLLLSLPELLLLVLGAVVVACARSGVFVWTAPQKGAAAVAVGRGGTVINLAFACTAYCSAAPCSDAHTQTSRRPGPGYSVRRCRSYAPVLYYRAPRRLAAATPLAVFS